MTDSPPADAPAAAPVPTWVRTLDALAVLGLCIAVSVLLFGGFRVMVAGVRLSVTDWWRPLAWSIVVAGVRHWRWRDTPLWFRLRRGVARWWRADETRAVLPIHLASRFGVLAVGFLAVALVGFPTADPPPFQIYRHALLDLPARWDAGWYLGIASEGYQWTEQDVGRQQNIAFFPAFPLVMRAVSVFLGRHLLWSGVVVSLVAFFWALIYLLRLGRDLIGDDSRAQAAVALLAAYPFALFYSAPYTEALFLLASVATVYHFRRDELWSAAAWGLLTGLTRPNGAFLSVVLGLLVLERARRVWAAGERFRWAGHLDRLAAAATPGMGMLFYSTYILFLTGSPFMWTAQNAAWGRTYRSLDTVFTDRVEYVTRSGFYSYIVEQPLDMFYLVSAIFMLGAVWPVYRRFGPAFAVLLLINLLPPMAAGGLLSIGRITSTLFPAFLWLGAAIPAHHRTGWLVGFAVLQGFAAVLFFTWRPLY